MVTSNGKFHGTIAPTTPTGSRHDLMAVFAPVRLITRSPRSVSHAYSSISLAGYFSPSASGASSCGPKVMARGEPTSRMSSSRSSSFSDSIASCSCSRQRLRSSRLVDQSVSSKARRAASMARCMSSFDASATSPSDSSVAGLMLVKVPAWPSTSLPSIIIFGSNRTFTVFVIFVQLSFDEALVGAPGRVQRHQPGGPPYSEPYWKLADWQVATSRVPRYCGSNSTGTDVGDRKTCPRMCGSSPSGSSRRFGSRSSKQVDGGAHFQPRQVHAQADVHAVPPAEVRLGLPVNVERVRIGIAIFLPVRRTQHRHHRRAGRDRHPAEFGVAGGHPGDGQQRRFPPHALFDGLRQQRPVRADSLQLLADPTTAPKAGCPASGRSSPRRRAAAAAGTRRSPRPPASPRRFRPHRAR